MEFTSRKLADVVLAVPAGSIDHPNAVKLQQALAPFVDEGSSTGRAPLVLDFTGVEYISSMGLRVLMVASKALRARNAAMAIAGLQPAVEEIFDIARFRMVVDVFPSVRDALAAISPDAAKAYGAAE
ncbi:MAG TPA: STAS domain-containing protein [Casimicrobiaceae bacterium]|nr:STAS domain-containing protein [Casimicrobiaceae bacterium]